MSFLNVYYITLCRLHEKYLTLNEIKMWQVCYSKVVTFAMAHYIVDLPNNQIFCGFLRELYDESVKSNSIHALA